MRKNVALLCIALLLIFALGQLPRANAAPFPVAPHNNVTIEWWYLNAHVTTASNRHLAVIASFFRIGNKQAMAADAKTPQNASPQSHYLIYAVTDLDAKTHVTYSLADDNTLKLLQEVASLAIMAKPNSPKAQEMMEMASSKKLPSPTLLIDGECHVAEAPFAADYGTAGSVKAVPGRPNTFLLTLGAPGSKLDLHMTFSSDKPTMYVGGNGDTGIETPTDMHYVSLTRCDVTGTIDTGTGNEAVKNGEGWFDHQWGDSWTTQSVGWDWFGLQLADGRDVLLFRQRDLATGKYFSALATIEDRSGKITVTKNVKFTPNYEQSLWRSPKTNINYPLSWIIDLPDQHLRLMVSDDIPNQEMPVLARGGAIWEGSVNVNAFPLPSAGELTNGTVTPIPGKGYMELVGYGVQEPKHDK